jgi:hypothetical protein
MYKKRAIVILCAALLTIGMTIGHFKPFPIREIKSIFTQREWKSPLNNYKLRESLFAAFAPTTKIVMAGDSLTELAVWSDIFPGELAKVVSFRQNDKKKTRDGNERIGLAIAAAPAQPEA